MENGRIVVDEVSQTRAILDAYLARAGFGATPLCGVSTFLKDSISELTVECLIARGPSSMSGIADWVRSAEGGCARATVRNRLGRLVGVGVIERSGERAYPVTPEFLREWIRVVGGEFGSSSRRPGLEWRGRDHAGCGN
jgi:hypothetical protein